MRIQLFIYTVAALAISFLSGCQDENDAIATEGEYALSFSPTVEDMAQQTLTRSGASSFFNNGDVITVKIKNSRVTAEESFPYTYSSANNEFTGGFRFKLDNTYVTELVALWPVEAERTEIITDQRDIEDYQKADRLKAEGSTENIMPTAEPVPLAFKHEQSRLTFRLAGQNANGLTIKDLILELQADVDNDGMNEETAFWAYCKADGTAELILPEGVQIGPNISDDGRMMVGLVTIASNTSGVPDYQGVIYIPNKTNIKTVASTDYLVTLTPEGYDLTASISINSFSQSEGYVGIPIQMPTEVSVGNYSIDNTLQLVTLSLLLKGGYIKGQDAATWKSYRYTLDSGVTMTDNGELYYKKIDASLKGILFNGTTTVKDAKGNDFELFE